jgi:hypothetical protein
VYRPPQKPQPLSPPVRKKRTGASKGVALGAIALVAVIVVALGIIIVMKWNPGGGAATTSRTQPATPSGPNAQGPFIAAGRADRHAKHGDRAAGPR